ncbi:hypothetical protein E2C01_079894 [Portunus trituberculatus]|uniref:Uncharacterized protein n=1 Tax=Portunus trituberculatus TaxID=210409 RepID=A0A5B7IY58_PORTR|nr:hypothetical protein [Portunus trituberculatus]
MGTRKEDEGPLGGGGGGGGAGGGRGGGRGRKGHSVPLESSCVVALDEPPRPLASALSHITASTTPLTTTPCTNTTATTTSRLHPDTHDLQDYHVAATPPRPRPQESFSATTRPSTLRP